MGRGVFENSLGPVLVMLAMVSMLGSACVSTEVPPPPPPPAPGGNQPPVISSLTATQTEVYPSDTTEVRCVASDPDGDQVDFKWVCTGGVFSGAKSFVTWKAPEGYGDCEVTVTVEDGKGGMAQASLSLSVVPNQNPDVASLVADPNEVLPGGRSTITCIATDPDGEELSYTWSASDGNISGVGDTATWFAPKKGGAFEIAVLVSDGKGGESTSGVSVTVAAAMKVVTLSGVEEETGTVSSDGDKDTSRTMAGDDENSVGYRAFWSFNIYGLMGTEIEDARLDFSARNMAGDPFSATTGLIGLRLWKVSYGQGRLPNFDITGLTLQEPDYVLHQPPSLVDVTPEMRRLVAKASTRFQVEALFMSETNGNGVAEWIEWPAVTLEVTYKEK